MYKKVFTALILTMIIVIAGCDYSYKPYGSEVQCDPPAQKMTDINGNTVCVIPSADTKPAEIITPKEDTSKETEPSKEAQTPSTEDTKETSTETKPAEESKESAVKADQSDISGLPKKTVKEGDLVSFPNLKAVDPDGDPITYTFSAPLDAKGEWQTKKGDAGSYIVTITASDGTNKVSQKVAIVVEAANSAPVITLKDEVRIKEGQTIKIVPEVKDPDGDKVTITYSGWMTTDTYQTKFTDAGTHEVTVTASDGTLKSSKTIKVIVEDVNRAPVISQVSPITVNEGELAKIDVKVSDPDSDKLTIKYSDPFNENGEWQTKKGDAGKYSIDITATDGKLYDIESVLVTVKSVNKAPVISGVSDMTVKEGETVTLSPTVTDPEGDEVKVTYSGWMTSNTKKLGYDDQGEHKVTITATDGINTVTKTVTITVEDVNRPPEFNQDWFN